MESWRIFFLNFTISNNFNRNESIKRADESRVRRAESIVSPLAFIMQSGAVYCRNGMAVRRQKVESRRCIRSTVGCQTSSEVHPVKKLRFTRAL